VGEHLRPDATTYVPPGQSNQNREAPRNDKTRDDNLPLTNFQPQERTHNTTKVENVSLMVIPALVSNMETES
jgi:hypothetical protein